MINILTVVGARPQIIKAAAISRAIFNDFLGIINEDILHTGQHYDPNMSQVFFDELGVPSPKYNLNVGSSSHGVQTAKMIQGIEELIYNLKPHYILLYGDTNSTLAGSVAASKLHIPIIHVEAGLRSFNKSMPEEINRLMCDHVSSLLFSPTSTGISNLLAEGFKRDNSPPFSIHNPGIFHCGDVMYDNSLYYAEISDNESTIITDLKLNPGQFVLATIHRPFNTDSAARLTSIMKSFIYIAEKNKVQIVLPLHPRTRKMIELKVEKTTYNFLMQSGNILITEPVSFFDIIQLEKHCKLVITDSGGVQKESYFFRKPCIVLRNETEWVEIVNQGYAKLSDASEEGIVHAFESFNSIGFKPDYKELFGDGEAAKFICETIIKNR